MSAYVAEINCKSCGAIPRNQRISSGLCDIDERSLDAESDRENDVHFRWRAGGQGSEAAEALRSTEPRFDAPDHRIDRLEADLNDKIDRVEANLNA